MKNKHLCKHISLLLAILMLLPLFAFGTTAKEAEISAAQSAEKAEADALAAKKANLVQGLEAASTIFNYIDKASFIKAGHVERLSEEEDLNSYVFRNEDGSKTVYFLDEDVKFVNAGGVVTEKKLELVALDGGFTTRSSNVSLALPTDLSRGITLAHGGATVSLVPNKASLSEVASVATASLFAAVEELEQSLVSAPIGISAGRADYQNAFGVGTTLRYTPTLSGVKEDVILDRYRGKNSFSFTLNTGNLTVFEENGRYFLAESAESEEKIFIGETWVYDSADHFEKGTLSVSKKADGVYTLTIGASTDFLTDPDTVYPVYIDPSLTVSNGEGYIEDVTVYSGNDDTNYGGANLCFVGKHPSYGTARTAIRITGLEQSASYSVAHNTFLESAILTLRAQTGGTTAANAKFYPLESEDWTESGATWNNIGEYIVDSTGEPMAQGALLVGTSMTFDVTNFVRDWKIDNAYYPYTAKQGFLMISDNESIQKRFCSSENATSSYRPYLTLNYRDGVEILSPDQPYRVVEDNEIVYVKQGETVQLEAAVYTTNNVSTWTSSVTSVASISSSLAGRCVINPTSYGRTTISVKNENNAILDSITVYVVPVIPGEYYIETPLESNRFIEPKTTVSANATLTVGALAEDEDNRLVVDFVPDDYFGYYTIKKMVKNSDNTYTPWYLGINTGTNGTKIKYYDDADVTGRRFDISFRSETGYYIVTPQLSGQWNRSLAANADAASPSGIELTIQNYTENSTYNDEWIFRRVLPLSGSEKIVNSIFWNSQGNLNCISYALNAICAENGDEIVSFVNSSDDLVLPWNENNVYEAFCKTAQEYGFLVERIGKYEACPKGYYKIAIAYADINNAGSSFHLYRQGVNGLWSHKKVWGNVSFVDAGSAVLIDPEFSNRNFVNNPLLSSYPYFIGYFAINPGNVLQPS